MEWPPVHVVNANSAVAIELGDSHACALFDDAPSWYVKCWGTNYYANLGVPYPGVELSGTPLPVDLFP
jgi:hypothetical protein